MTKTFATFLLLLTSLAQADERPSESLPGTVTLPLAEYDRLLERAQKPKRGSEPPPLAAVLARAEARLTVSATHVHGSFQIDGEVFADGITRVPLLAGAMLLEAKSAGKPVALLDDSGTLVALLPGKSPFSLQLEWAAPLVSEPGRASFQLPVPRAGSVKAVIELPGEQAEVRLEPGLVTARSAAGGKTRIEATLEPGTSVRVSWSAREAATAPPREARLLADLKTLATVGEAELQLSVLGDVTVVEGEAERLTLELPRGYEITGVTGSTLESTAEAPGTLTLQLREPQRRRHQFLLSLQRTTEPGSFKSELPFVSVRGVQRESGELALSGLGTLELEAHESGTLRRMDVSEASPALRALTREPLLQAFRYQRRAGDGPAVTLDVKRFEPQAVLAALAERATATTLVTAEGRMLTEVKLQVRNQAQPFVKLGLPAGATLLSAEVAGQGVKPVQGQDGTRVPLLRAGFRPSGPYEVSFVYLQPGQPFGKRGEAQLSLPRLDLPVSLLLWELFLPDRYEVKRFEGNVLRQAEAQLRSGSAGAVVGGVVGGVPGSVSTGSGSAAPLAVSGVIGRATDQQGEPVPGVTVVLLGDAGQKRVAVSDANGWYFFAGPPAGQYRLSSELTGFNPVQRKVRYSSGRYVANFVLKVGGLEETVTVMAEAPDALDLGARQEAAPQVQQNAPSENVYALQKRVAGVLPVNVDVPHAGESFRFVRPLVLDEETTVSFRYKAR